MQFGGGLRDSPNHEAAVPRETDAEPPALSQRQKDHTRTASLRGDKAERPNVNQEVEIRKTTLVRRRRGAMCRTNGLCSYAP